MRVQVGGCTGAIHAQHVRHRLFRATDMHEVAQTCSGVNSNIDKGECVRRHVRLTKYSVSKGHGEVRPHDDADVKGCGGRGRDGVRDALVHDGGDGLVGGGIHQL